MSTKTQTTGSDTSNLQFNPLAQSIYNSLIGSGGSTMQDFMNAPISNASYLQGAAQSQNAAKTAGANMLSTLGQNKLALGLGGQSGAGWLDAQKSQATRAGQAVSSKANISNILAAMQRQMTAAGTGLSFSPQLTGQTGKFTQTQTTGGLGSYLPQILSGIGGGLMGGLMGGGGGGSSMPFSSGGAPTNVQGMTGMINPGMLTAGTSGLGNLEGILSSAGSTIPSFNPMMMAMGGGYGG